MSSETVYLKIAQITEVYKPDVHLSDIAEVHCQNKAVEAKVKALKVTSFKVGGSPGAGAGQTGAGAASGKSNSGASQVGGSLMSKKRVYSYVGSVIDLLKQVEDTDKNIQVNSLGEAGFVVKYRPGKGNSKAFQWLKTFVVAVIAFCGAAFAIMTFNNDASVMDVFGRIYYLVMGTQLDGVTVLEFSYSLGLTFGILIFFNHFATWKLTVDPTPTEVEMRMYEENTNKTLIQNDGRKEKRIDVT